MCITKKQSLSLIGIFSTAMLALLLCLLGNSPVQAAAEPPITQQEAISSADPRPLPAIDYVFYLTEPWYYDGNWNLVDGGVFEADGQSDETGRVSGQASLQLLTSLQLVFVQVESILRDANQNPVGVRMNGRGYTADGRTFNFIYITQRTPQGRCCAVEIQAPEIHASGLVRFEAAGELRFEQR